MNSDAFFQIISNFGDKVLFFDVLFWTDKAQLPFLICWLLMASIYFAVITGFINFKKLPAAIIAFIKGKKTVQNGAASSKSIVLSAIAGATDLGSIFGVAGIVAIGGAGTIFWLIIAGFLSTSIRYAEVLCGHKFRRKVFSNGKCKGYIGGPQVYIPRIFKMYKMPKLGKLDDESLKLVEVEFNRLKKRTPFKDYRISEYLDSGGFARVYCVRCPTSEVKFALRISEEEEHYNEREIQAVRQLMNQGQKHIVEYLMYFTVNTRFGKKYCALMPFLSPLSKYNNTSDDIEIAVRCGNDLLPVLQSCSEVVEGQIIHRDIKPQNIFFDNDFRKDRGLMLGDFGIARIENETQRVTPIGSLETISPEIGANDIDIMHDHHLCDIYSLGIVMYYYLNGHVYPFDNDHKKRLQTKGALPEPRYGRRVCDFYSRT